MISTTKSKPSAHMRLQKQRVVAATRLEPNTYDWMVKTPWLTRFSVSKTLELAIRFVRDNEQDFKRFCDEQDGMK